MKGLITALFFVISLSAHASLGINARNLTAIKLNNGDIVGNLSLQESTKVLKSLDLSQNIEIRARVIYPEEVSGLIARKLTKGRFVEKRPNPQDYN